MDLTIRAACPRFACCDCRTMTGWPHQPWCRLRTRTAPDCSDCRYFDPSHSTCVHPSLNKPVRVKALRKIKE